MAGDDVPAALRPLFSSITSLFADSRWSDLEIRCGGRTWAAHKNIVCSQSDYFLKACDGNFKEAVENAITLEQDSPDAVHALLQFLYSGDYDEVTQSEGESGGALVFHLQVHSLADKYNLPQLASLASKKFGVYAENVWDTVAFSNAVEEIYQTPDAGNMKAPREHAVRIALQHVNELKTMDESNRFREVLRRVPGLAADVLETAPDEAFELHWLNCPGLCENGRRLPIPDRLMRMKFVYCPCCKTGWYPQTWVNHNKK